MAKIQKKIKVQTWFEKNTNLIHWFLIDYFYKPLFLGDFLTEWIDDEIKHHCKWVRTFEAKYCYQPFKKKSQSSKYHLLDQYFLANPKILFLKLLPVQLSPNVSIQLKIPLAF